MIVEWMQQPKTILLLFDSYIELRNWVRIHEMELTKEQAKFSKTTNIITFPNGAKLILGHIETAYDYDRYLGLEYDYVRGGNEQLTRRSKIFKI